MKDNQKNSGGGMKPEDLVRTSKRLSRILRHAPESVGIELDAAGWVPVADLLAGLAGTGRPLDRADLDRVVAENSKQRFAFDETGTLIRANQGHSVPVELGLAPADPPDVLYHGTHPAAVESIRHEGLLPMFRHHVHLSATTDTARTVGARRGKPVVLTVLAARMAADGHVFHVSDNGVWLTAAVPPRYLDNFDLAGGQR